jgi:hypothetical protein
MLFRQALCSFFLPSVTLSLLVVKCQNCAVCYVIEAPSQCQLIDIAGDPQLIELPLLPASLLGIILIFFCLCL